MKVSAGFVVFVAVVVIVVILVVNRGMERAVTHSMEEALKKVGATIDQKTGDIVVQNKTLADNLSQATTVNTTHNRALAAEVRKLQDQNKTLKAELERLGGKVTALSVSVGAIDLGGGDTVNVGTGDFTFPYTDPWIKASIARAGERLSFRYDTTFRLEEFDVEVTMPGGVKTHLFNTALVSATTGDTLHVPVERHVIERLPATGSRLYWNPQLHLEAGVGLSHPWAGGGVSLLSWGESRHIDATTFYGLEGMVWAGEGEWTVGVSPVAWNLGRVLPLLRNLSIGMAWIWTEENSGPALRIGAAL